MAEHNEPLNNLFETLNLCQELEPLMEKLRSLWDVHRPSDDDVLSVKVSVRLEHLDKSKKGVHVRASVFSGGII